MRFSLTWTVDAGGVPLQGTLASSPHAQGGQAVGRITAARTYRHLHLHERAHPLTHMHSYVHTRRERERNRYMRTSTCTLPNTHTHTHTHTRTHTHTHTRSGACAHQVWMPQTLFRHWMCAGATREMVTQPPVQSNDAHAAARSSSSKSSVCGCVCLIGCDKRGLIVAGCDTEKANTQAHGISPPHHHHVHTACTPHHQTNIAPVVPPIARPPLPHSHVPHSVTSHVCDRQTSRWTGLGLG